MVFCADKGDTASFAAAVFLGDAVDGETLYFVEDVEAAAEVDLPAVVQADEAVVGGVKVVGKVDATRGEVIGDGVEDVDNIRAVFIIVGRGKVDFETFRIFYALADSIDEFDEVINLVRKAHERVGQLNLTGIAEVRTEEFDVGHAALVHTYFFDGAGKVLRSDLRSRFCLICGLYY